jgi:hypothetical protein
MQFLGIMNINNVIEFARECSLLTIGNECCIYFWNRKCWKTMDLKSDMSYIIPYQHCMSWAMDDVHSFRRVTSFYSCIKLNQEVADIVKEGFK